MGKAIHIFLSVQNIVGRWELTLHQLKARQKPEFISLYEVINCFQLSLNVQRDSFIYTPCCPTITVMQNPCLLTIKTIHLCSSRNKTNTYTKCLWLTSHFSISEMNNSYRNQASGTGNCTYGYLLYGKTLCTLDR